MLSGQGLCCRQPNTFISLFQAVQRSNGIFRVRWLFLWCTRIVYLTSFNHFTAKVELQYKSAEVSPAVILWKSKLQRVQTQIRQLYMEQGPNWLKPWRIHVCSKTMQKLTSADKNFWSIFSGDKRLTIRLLPKKWIWKCRLQKSSAACKCLRQGLQTNSVDQDRTAPRAVWSEYTVCYRGILKGIADDTQWTTSK